MFHELQSSESIDPAHLMSDSSSDEQNDNDNENNSVGMNDSTQNVTKMAKKITSKLVDKTLANETLFNNNSAIDPLNVGYLPLARGHWALLSQTPNCQMNICKRMIINVLIKYPQMRPVWHFSRKLDFDTIDWQEEIQLDHRFRHHCASIQAAITMMMENLNDMNGMAKLLRELGNHHFFYDACEPQYELMQEGFMMALNNQHGPLEDDLLQGWNQFWSHLKASISYGIGIQRQNYLRECVTLPEIQSIRIMWEKVKEHGLEDVGQRTVKYALQTYHELIKKHKIDLPVNLPVDSVAFKVYSQQVINAVDITIGCYSPEKGFQNLPRLLKGFVVRCLMVDVCPTLIRKSFMDALIKILTEIHGEETMTEVTIHTWSKIYRILEQAIIWNVIHY